MEDFTHHGVVVARRAVALDVELAVGVFDEAFWPRNDHGAHSVGTLDMRVVVDLNALGWTAEAEGFADTVEQLALG